MGKHMTQEEMETVLELQAKAETAVRRLAEYMEQFGKDRITDSLTEVSQVVTRRAHADGGCFDVWVVRMVVPTSTGGRTPGLPLASHTKLDPRRKYNRRTAQDGNQPEENK